MITEAIKDISRKAMSTNCIRCVGNRRTSSDLLCDDCRKKEHQYCKYFALTSKEEFKWCPVGNRGVIMEPASYCYDCLRYQDKERIKANGLRRRTF